EIGGGSRAEIVMNSKTIGGTWNMSWENVSRNSKVTDIHPGFDASKGNVYACYMEGAHAAWDIVFTEKKSGAWQSTYSIGASHYPELAADDNQNVFAAFYCTGGAFYVRERISGAWRDSVDISTLRAEKGFGDIAVKNNIVAVTFSQHASTGRTIFLRQKIVGQNWLDAVEVEPGTNASYPQLALDNEGNAHVVWGETGRGGNKDIFYKKIALFLPNKPYINLNKTSLSFEAVEEGSNPSPQVFQIQNSGVDTLSYSMSTNRSWLTVSPTSGTSTGEWDNITVNVDSYSLKGGYYTGTITITAPEAPNSPREVTVNLAVKPKNPYLELDKESLYFVGYIGASNPPSQVFNIRNFGVGTMSYIVEEGVAWMSASPLSGTSTGEWDPITVKVDITDLAEGKYSGTITVKSSEATNSPVQLPVTLEVKKGAYARIKLNKTSMTFRIQKGQSTYDSKNFQIKNGNAGTLHYQLSSEADWISVFPESGNSSGEWDKITVNVDASGLSSGQHTGEIIVSSYNASNSPQRLKVTLIKEAPGIKLSKYALDFTAVKGGGNPENKTFKVKNSGRGTLGYSIKSNKEWLRFNPKSGISKGEWDEISVSVTTSTLKPGKYTAILNITAPEADNSPQSLVVSLSVLTPTIQLNKKLLSFTAQEGQDNPSPQNFLIRNSGAGTLSYKVKADKNWINVTPKSGKCKGGWTPIKVSLNISSLEMGNLQGTITVSATHADNSPKQVNVKLKLNPPPYPYAPVRARLERIENVSLFYSVFINKITWKHNSKNDGRFNVIKYKVFRKESDAPIENLVLIDEVYSDNPFVYYDEFSSQEERDKYSYAVTAVDDLGRESEKALVRLKK
ncbi:MAG: BACON domain-containing protein, partial [Candidatus Aerophobus sp.]